MQVLAARARLANLPLTRLVLASPLYASRPLGPRAQPDFVNAVAGVLTRLDAVALLGELRGIETALGRPVERERWGPRVIDLDLLSFARERRPHGFRALDDLALATARQVAPAIFGDRCRRH